MRRRTKTIAGGMLAIAMTVCLCLGIGLMSVFAATPVEGAATPWTDYIHGTTTSLLDNGNYALTLKIRDANPGGRIAYDYPVDFGTFEATLDMTETVTGTYPYFLCLNFSKDHNNFLYAETGSFTLVLERHQKLGLDAMRMLLYKHHVTDPVMVDGVAAEVSFELDQTQALHIKIEKTETEVVFHCNNASIAVPVSYFYGDSRQVFTDAEFDGSRYLTLNVLGETNTTEYSQPEAIKISISPLKDALTVAYENSVAEMAEKVTAYVSAAEALTDTCTEEQVAAAEALKETIDLDILRPYTTSLADAAERIAAADAKIAAQKERLAAANPTPVEGGSTMTPWNQHVATSATLLTDGNYQLTIPAGGFGVRAGADYPVDFGTFTITIDMTNAITGTYPDWMLLCFVKGVNKYFNIEDSGSLTVALERHAMDPNSMRVLLYSGYFQQIQDINGNNCEITLDLTESKILNFRIEKTDSVVRFHCNDKVMEIATSYFYGDNRQIFNSDGDVFDGSRYVILGTQWSGNAVMTPVLSPFQDDLTKAYEASVADLIAKVNEYVAMAEALNDSSSAEAVLAAEALRSEIDLSKDEVRNYTRNYYNVKIVKADELVAVQRARLTLELLEADIANFVAAAEAVADRATLSAAEIALSKIDMAALEGLDDEAKKAALTEQLNNAQAVFMTKTDAVIESVVADFEAKTASLDSTEKLISAVTADKGIDSAFIAKASAEKVEGFNNRITAARAKITEAKTFDQYTVTDGAFATTTADGSIGYYVGANVGTGVPAIYLNDRVTATNVSIDLTMKQFPNGFFAIQVMEKKESFINGTGTDVAGNMGIVIKINLASATATSYDVTLYNIRATSANGFEGCLVTSFSAPVTEGGKINVVLLQSEDYVDLIVNGTKMINNRMKKTTVQGMFGAELKGYLSLYSTLNAGDATSYYEIELNKINGKSVFAEDVAEPVIVEATGITLNKNSATLAVDANLLLLATVAPDNVTDNSVTWASSDEDVAIVDETGYVTALAEGTVTITATTANGLTATCTITVTADGEPVQPSGCNCGGSITAAAGMLALLLLASAVVVLKKKSR